MKKPKLKPKHLGNIEYTKSSGNVFADIGLPNPEEALAKSQIAIEIRRVIKKKKLTQAKAAKILKIDQPKLSRLLRGYLTNFSLERLFRFLNDLGQNIHVTITPSSHRGHGSTMIGDSPSNVRVAALSK